MMALEKVEGTDVHEHEESMAHIRRCMEELAIRGIKKTDATIRACAACGTILSSNVSYIILDHNLEKVNEVLNIINWKLGCEKMYLSTKSKYQGKETLKTKYFSSISDGLET
jgi:hypothetical protein